MAVAPIVAAPINGALGAFLSFKGICSARDPREAITFELRILALSVVLGLVHIVLLACYELATRLSLDRQFTREAVPRLTGMAGRLERALRNFVETFPLSLRPS
jgi:hypothetical protein